MIWRWFNVQGDKKLKWVSKEGLSSGVTEIYLLPQLARAKFFSILVNKCDRLTVYFSLPSPEIDNGFPFWVISDVKFYVSTALVIDSTKPLYEVWAGLKSELTYFHRAGRAGKNIYSVRIWLL